MSEILPTNIWKFSLTEKDNDKTVLINPKGTYTISFLPETNCIKRVKIRFNGNDELVYNNSFIYSEDTILHTNTMVTNHFRLIDPNSTIEYGKGKIDLDLSNGTISTLMEGYDKYLNENDELINKLSMSISSGAYLGRTTTQFDITSIQFILESDLDIVEDTIHFYITKYIVSEEFDPTATTNGDPDFSRIINIATTLTPETVISKKAEHNIIRTMELAIKNKEVTQVVDDIEMVEEHEASKTVPTILALSKFISKANDLLGKYVDLIDTFSKDSCMSDVLIYPYFVKSPNDWINEGFDFENGSAVYNSKSKDDVASLMIRSQFFLQKGMHFIQINIGILTSGSVKVYDETSTVIKEFKEAGIYRFVVDVKEPSSMVLTFKAENVLPGGTVKIDAIFVYHVGISIDQYFAYKAEEFIAGDSGFISVNQFFIELQALQKYLKEYTDNKVDTAFADVFSHINNTKNPHNTTHVQVGAAPTIHTHTYADIIPTPATATHLHTPVSIGAADIDHTHTPNDIGAANKNHFHLPSDCGAAPEVHTHTPISIDAADRSHSHTPVSIDAADRTHTHTPSECDAAPIVHEHLPEDIGAAPISHTHIPSDCGAAPEVHTHTPISIDAADRIHTHDLSDLDAASRIHTHIPTECGAAPEVHTHTPDQCEAAPENHLHDPIEIGAAPYIHTHTPDQCGAAPEIHTHTPEELHVASELHTHIPAEIGAADRDHTHLPEECGAAPEVHTHTVSDISNIGTVLSDITDLSDELLSHLNNKDNPHNVTKDQINLGNVENYPPATMTEAIAGTPERMIEPNMVHAIIDARIGSLDDNKVLISRPSNVIKFSLTDTDTKKSVVIKPNAKYNISFYTETECLKYLTFRCNELSKYNYNQSFIDTKGDVFKSKQVVDKVFRVVPTDSTMLFGYGNINIDTNNATVNSNTICFTSITNLNITNLDILPTSPIKGNLFTNGVLLSGSASITEITSIQIELVIPSTDTNYHAMHFYITESTLSENFSPTSTIDMADLGTVRNYIGDIPPNGWGVLDGSEINVDEHIDIFNLANLRNKVIPTYEYDQYMQKDKCCYYFGYDSGSTTMKLPTYPKSEYTLLTSPLIKIKASHKDITYVTMDLNQFLNYIPAIFNTNG